MNAPGSKKDSPMTVARPLPKLTVVIGGAASGKSAFAEALVLASSRPRIYVATAEVWDAEMAAKVAAHRAARGAGWRTVEEPRDIARALREVSPAEAVLIDCATLWLTNVMLADPAPSDAALVTAMSDLLATLAACPAPVVIVTNETGQGIVPDNALARRFRSTQGTLNQGLAAQAGLVVAVIAGLPLVLKGALP